ncbi:MAG: hypothetical protein WD065_02050 [Planctomycetaceae bacterium]
MAIPPGNCGIEKPSELSISSFDGTETLTEASTIRQIELFGRLDFCLLRHERENMSIINDDLFDFCFADSAQEISMFPHCLAECSGDKGQFF